MSLLGRAASTLRRTHLAFAGLLGAMALSAGCSQKSSAGSSSSNGASGASQRCASCHLAEFLSVSHPPHAGVRPTTCATCHIETSWHPYRLAHSWPLEGAHAKAACFDCHRGEPRKFEGTDKACLSCHLADDEQANQKVSHHAQFPTTCETCHTTVAWKPTLPHETQAAEQPVTLEPVTPSVSPASRAVPPRVAAPARRPKTAPAATVPPVPNTGPPAVKPKPDTVTGASPPWRR